jgi:dTDP-4-dehydrorhamnose reductase
MILLLGGTGYIGSAFVRELQSRGSQFKALSRHELDYTQFDSLHAFLKSIKAEFVINAAGYTGKPNVDACELAKADTLLGNAVLPHTVATACAALDIPWGHVSSGCIYSGAKIVVNGKQQVEKDLTKDELRTLVDRSPESVSGFTEADPPNFSFRDGPCSFYSGAKALGEEVLAGVGHGYIWRLRIPFDEFDGPRNYLSKLQSYPKVYDNVNSISHRGDFAAACLDLWQKRAAFGTYNVTNPGFVTTRQVVALIQEVLTPDRTFEFWRNDADFYKTGAVAPRSNCVMDVSKLLRAGVKIRPVAEALKHSLTHWRTTEAQGRPPQSASTR